MKHSVVLLFAACVFLPDGVCGQNFGDVLNITRVSAVSSYGKTPWYVSTASLETSPAEPGPNDIITLTLRGQWPDSCVPTQSRTRIQGNEIYVELLDESADWICATVISPWSSVQTTGPLKKGVYDVYLAVYIDSWDSGKTTTPYLTGTVHVGNIKFSHKKSLLAISHCEVIAGKVSDSIRFSGTLDAALADLQTAMADGNDIIVSIDADDIPDPNVTRWTFPIDNKALKKDMYNYARAVNASQQFFKLDTKNGKMQFSAKNVDLTGLACPFEVTITIGDYSAAFELDEAVVNGTKPCPAPLMRGLWNNLDITQFAYKRGKATGTDTLSAQGTFSVAGNILLADPFVLTLGSQSFTVEGNKFTSSNGITSCTNAAVQEGGLASVKLDTNKSLFSIAIKNASITNFGVVAFNLNLSGVPLSSIDFEMVNLGDPFVGKRTMTNYGNDNIRDTDTAGMLHVSKVTTATSTSNNSDYVIKAKGVSFSMTKETDNLLALNPQPQNQPGWVTPNAYILSDGINGAFVLTGQEGYDPQDISVTVSSWSRPAVVTGAKLAGAWNITWIFDDDIMYEVQKPFETENDTLTITDLGNNQVNVDFGGTVNWVMNIAGNSLVPVTAIDPSIKHFSMVTDGNGIAISLIGFDTNDLTEASAKIGLAARRP